MAHNGQGSCAGCETPCEERGHGYEPEGWLYLGTRSALPELAVQWQQVCGGIWHEKVGELVAKAKCLAACFDMAQANSQPAASEQGLPDITHMNIGFQVALVKCPHQSHSPFMGTRAELVAHLGGELVL